MMLPPLALTLLLATRWYWAPIYPGTLPADSARQGVYVCDILADLPVTPVPALGETAYVVSNGKTYVYKGVVTGWVELAGSSGAPVDAQYWVGAADATLTQEKNLGALGTAFVINTAGVPSAYTGMSCTDQFPRSLSAVGAATCASVVLATDLSTFSSSDLRGRLTDEAGTGPALFGLISTMTDDLACTGSQVVRRNAGDTAFECATPSSGSGNFGTFTVSFGSGALSLYDSAESTVTAAWVASGSSILLTPKCVATVGGNTIDNCLVSKLQCSVATITASTSFGVVCYAPFTASGSYTISYTGG